MQNNYNKIYSSITPVPTHIIGPTLEEAGLVKLQTDESQYAVYVHVKEGKTCFLIVPVGPKPTQELCIN
jgi:hypothetical protein